MSDDKCFFGNSSKNAEFTCSLIFLSYNPITNSILRLSKMSKDKGEIGRWSSSGQKLYNLQKKSFNYIILRLCRLKEIEEYTKFILIAASPLLIGFARMSDAKCYPFTLCS